jgi:hypothetical protein
MIRDLLTVPYELARLPLAIVDDRVVARLPETSVPRVTLDRALGSADKLAGTLLGSPDIAQRGADRLERSSKLRTATRLEEEAEARREQAQETAATGRSEAAEKRKAAQDRAVTGLDEAAETEARGKQQAKASAKRTASAKKTAADERAAGRTDTIEQRQGSVESAAEAKKRAAQREAKDELKDARETAESATEARTDADRLEELTEVKKEQRQQD